MFSTGQQGPLALITQEALVARRALARDVPQTAPYLHANRKDTCIGPARRPDPPPFDPELSLEVGRQHKQRPQHLPQEKEELVTRERLPPLGYHSPPSVPPPALL